ncbi:radical SAM/SPASM domain-containing protein [Thermodesulfobacteriota bacterium]
MLKIPNIPTAFRITRALVKRRPFPLALRCRLTYRCQANCSYCALPSKQMTELSTQDWLTLFDQARRAGTARVAFDGGEPLLRDDVRTLAERVLGLGMVLSVNTNGLLVKDHLDWLTRVHVVKLSLDGGEETHERSRHGVPLEKVIEAAELLRRKGATLNFAFTMTAQTLPSIDSALEIAARVGASVVFQPVFQLRLAEDLSSLIPDPGLFREAVDHLIGIKRENPGLIRNSPAMLRRLRSWPDFPFKGCSAGRLFMVVEPDGNVVPCERKKDLSSVRWAPDFDFIEAMERTGGGFRCQGCGFLGVYRLTSLMRFIPMKAG